MTSSVRLYAGSSATAGKEPNIATNATATLRIIRRLLKPVSETRHDSTPAPPQILSQSGVGNTILALSPRKRSVFIARSGCQLSDVSVEDGAGPGDAAVSARPLIVRGLGPDRDRRSGRVETWRGAGCSSSTPTGSGAWARSWRRSC